MTDQNDRKGDPGPDGRRPWTEPGISWEEALEVRRPLALACAWHIGENEQCDDDPAS